MSLIDEAQPWQGKKNGADRGIDGIRYFRDLDRKEVHTILISVKGGENVGPAMVKDLIATLARDKADIGLFITLTAPTKAMQSEAAAAGFYADAKGKEYPRLQLLTIEGLLNQTQRPNIPTTNRTPATKRRRASRSRSRRGCCKTVKRCRSAIEGNASRPTDPNRISAASRALARTLQLAQRAPSC
ncbi:MAG: hypothetical protein QOD99_1187 [Chthoniobacter sp.]|nr:hypothetical protein [Chthoniobacter sp.]